ncbi:MAG TPA: hypothetical protein VG939_01210 [Caulobacteraceae bacterium]|nr:hypothetical protein [Caulobacteraceae bacterium]
MVTWAALAAVLAATPAAAQVAQMTGAWRGYAQGVTFNLVVEPNGRFSEQEIMGQMMTMQTGHIQPLGGDLVAFVVEDWQPRTRPVYHPTGTVGGYYTQEPNAKPPGGTWRILFNGPRSMTMRDARLGGQVTFTRQR